MRETRLSGSEGGVRSQSLIPTSIPRTGRGLSHRVAVRRIRLRSRLRPTSAFARKLRRDKSARPVFAFGYDPASKSARQARTRLRWEATARQARKKSAEVGGEGKSETKEFDLVRDHGTL
jgi:hypothetical protein